jgi:uncharacterized protein (DUF983 family)
MTCPKCGETRLIEQLDRHQWFCVVCAHSWTIGAKEVSHAEHEERSASTALGLLGKPDVCKALFTFIEAAAFCRNGSSESGQITLQLPGKGTT